MNATSPERGRQVPRNPSKNCKEFLLRFSESWKLIAYLENWLRQSVIENSSFGVPFELIDLQKFDYAVEGIQFEQVIRMPNSVHASTSDAAEENARLALEDFLHAGVKGLWEAFWGGGDGGSFPFSVTSSGKLGQFRATAVIPNDPKRRRRPEESRILELVLSRSELWSFSEEGDRRTISLSVLSDALFHAVRLLLSRSDGSRSSSGPVFILLVDSQYGGVVRVAGDLSKLILDANDVYERAAEWIKVHSRIHLSPFDRIWNKLGNADWRDTGALHLLFATFHSIVQFAGKPKISVDDLAADHSCRLQARRKERSGSVDDDGDNDGDSDGDSDGDGDSDDGRACEAAELGLGSVLWMDDSGKRKCFQVTEVLCDGDIRYYIVYAEADEESGRSLYLYLGSPACLPGTSSWYQVQRQTKVMNMMKQKGISSRFLPVLCSSGRVVDSASPVLVAGPVGETVADLVNDGRFGPSEAVRCCHDCLSAFSAAASVGIRHGDVRPETVIFVRRSHFAVVGWGRAVVDERDRPAMNLHFSSTFALEEGKLCPASDSESLVYLLFFGCGGALPELDSVEGALLWREKSWCRRLIQNRLGNVSALLKAFADYVDSLCGTPYPINYDIWLRRLKKSLAADENDIADGSSNSGYCRSPCK